MVKTVTHKQSLASQGPGKNNIPYFGDEELLKIAPKRSFSAMIFELLSSAKPDIHQAKIFELILNISIDHGPDTPSAIETIKAAKEEKTISEAVAVGISQINDTHGGAIEPAMELFYKAKSEKRKAKSIVEEYLSGNRRVPGFGHRIYEVDPRAQLILEIAQKEGIGKEFADIANGIETELKNKKGKPIPVNVDGAIAAVLCGFGWDPSLGKAVFLTARTPGLSGQYLNAKHGK